MTELGAPASSATHPANLGGGVASLAVRWGVFLILVATLFPYQFMLSEGISRLGRGFPLSHFGVGWGLRDAFANLLLFLPLGFGLAGRAAMRNIRWQVAIPSILAVSSALSLAIELLQVFLPLRDPALIDVVINTLGAFLGLLSFRVWGDSVFQYASALVEKSQQWLSPKKLTACFLGYGAVCFLLSIPLQQTSRLSNWDKTFPLLLGNESTANRPWQGRILRLQIANWAISEEAAKAVSAGGSLDLPQEWLVASYEPTNEGSYADIDGLSPELSWKGELPELGETEGIQLSGNSWLESVLPAASLVERIQETNQFTVSIRCATLSTFQLGSRIVSLSVDPYRRNFTLGQQEEDLVLRVRTPLTGKNGTKPQLVVPDIFATREPRNLVVTYDGSKLLLFVDGDRHPYFLELGPGAALFSHLIPLVVSDMRGYKAIYYGLVFAPLGLVLGFAAGEPRRWSIGKKLLLGAGITLPPFLLEWILTRVHRGPPNPENLLLGICIVVGGALLVGSPHR